MLLLVGNLFWKVTVQEMTPQFEPIYWILFLESLGVPLGGGGDTVRGSDTPYVQTIHLNGVQ